MISALFDDHCQALAVWREAGLRNLTCVHVDAHLDVMEDGFGNDTLAGLAGGGQPSRYRDRADLPWGGLHCGNFLYPALREGTVTTLIWVMPPWLLPASTGPLDAALQELGRWMDLSFDEYRSFREQDGYVEGQLVGRRLILCTSDTLPPLPQHEPTVLDIDLDYFVRLQDDRLWQTPHQLQAQLAGLRPRALTVAMSCQGGYTPTCQRYLGKVCLDVFSNQPQRWRSELQAMLDAEREGDRAWERLLNKVPAAWLPAVLCRLGRQQEASALDDDYRYSPLDQAARRFQQGRWLEGLEILQGSHEPGSARFLLAALLHRADHLPAEQVDLIAALLARPELSDLERARGWLAQAEGLRRAGQIQQATALLKKVVKIEPERALGHFRLAQALQAVGQDHAAARFLRKALRLAQGRVSSLAMLKEACRLYDRMGQTALARQTRKELEANDVSGITTAESLLERRATRSPAQIKDKNILY